VTNKSVVKHKSLNSLKRGHVHSIELGKLLQEQAADTEVCVVKMSQPHVHQATGPLFHLGNEIVKKLKLQPALYNQHSRAERNPSTVCIQQGVEESECSDVEPSHDLTRCHYVCLSLTLSYLHTCTCYTSVCFVN